MKKILLSLIILMSVSALQTHAQNAEIDTTETIEIGGIKQVISIKGTDRKKPILLYLHGAGGAGFSIISKADQLTAKLQKHFIVVLWDQREYGETLKLNKSPQPLTLELIKDDAHEVVEYLLKKFGRKKLYIVGHSMGTVLGFHIAQKYPELLSALVAMSPPINEIQSQKIALKTLKKHFAQLKNERAVRELAEVNFDEPSLQQMINQYRWQTEYDGERITDEQIQQMMPFFTEWEKTWGAVFKELHHLNRIKDDHSLNCPVYFFAGRKDFQTNSTITENFYKKLKAPKKGFYWFENSAHNIPDSETDLMQEVIINRILPETF